MLALAEIIIGRVKKPSLTEQELYEAIERRHTSRQRHKIFPAPPENLPGSIGTSLPDQPERQRRPSGVTPRRASCLVCLGLAAQVAAAASRLA